MNVNCFICDESVDIERIPGHLHHHVDSETKIAYQRVLADRKKMQESRLTEQEDPPKIDTLCQTSADADTTGTALTPATGTATLAGSPPPDASTTTDSPASQECK